LHAEDIYHHGNPDHVSQEFSINVITKSPQIITFNSVGNKTYGDIPFALPAAASSGLPVTYSLVSGPATLNGNMLTITGAGTIIVNASQSGDNDYFGAADVQQTITVLPRSIEVTADPKSKVYGESDPALTFQITGGSLVGTDVITGS
jgi:MBG domain (YGX type)